MRETLIWKKVKYRIQDINNIYVLKLKNEMKRMKSRF